MKKNFVFVLMVGVLMLGLVAGAGYNVVVPDAADDGDSPGGSSPGGGGGLAVNTTNETVANETTGAVASGDEVVDDEQGAGISGVIDNIKSGAAWVWTVGVMVVLLVIGGVVWIVVKKK